ncbi:hypothetical protein C8Q76DRAFT_736357, partial [Earliella scabrosa]
MAQVASGTDRPRARVAREASELSSNASRATQLNTHSDLRGHVGPPPCALVRTCVAGPPAQATNACYGQGSTVWIQGAARPYADLARVGKYTLSSGALRVLR